MPSAPIRMSASARLDDLAVAIDEARRDLAALLLEARDAPAELDPLRAQHLLGGVEQDHLQLAAMDGELRPRQAGMAAARIGPDRLAVAVGVAQLARLDGGGGQRRLEAEAREDADGAGLDVDADAERLQLAHRLEDRRRRSRRDARHIAAVRPPMPAPAMTIFIAGSGDRGSVRDTAGRPGRRPSARRRCRRARAGTTS